MRMITLLMLACCALMSLAVNAQNSTYAQANHYPFVKSSTTFTNLSGGTTLPSTFNADEQKAAIPIGFTFNFCGVNYNTVYASSNGWVSFKDVPSPGTHWYYDNLTSNLSAVVPSLFPFWDDLQGSTSGTASSASYSTTGSAPTRIFTLEYRNWRYYGASGPSISFQVKLYENGGNNLIEYVYRQEATPPAVDGATIGIAKSATDYAVLTNASANPGLVNNSFVNNITTRPATGQSYLFGMPVMISSVPADKLICAGTTTTFTIISSNATAYQWQVYNGTTWSNVSNGPSYSGVTSNTLTVINAQPGQNNYEYRCLLSYNGPGGVGTITTLPATLRVNTEIMTQPVSQTVCEGVAAMYSCSATGIGLTYQWQVNNGAGFTNVNNGLEYSGATTNTLTVVNPTASMNNYLYRCRVSSSCAPAVNTNDFASLTVRTKPTITSATMPDNLACTNSPTSFSITATGTNITYKWQENTGSGFNDLTNSGMYNGVTTNTLTIKTPALPMDGYRYRCIVTGICPSPAVSNEPIMNVKKLTTITKDVIPSQTVCDSVNIAIGIKADGASLVYQWEESISNSPFADVSNVGSFSGATTDTLWITNPTSVLSGRVYRCRINGTCGNLNTSNSKIIVNGLPHVEAQPADAVVEALKKAYFVVQANGAQLHYQWQSNDNQGEWQNLFDNYAYKGANKSTLEVIGTYEDKDGYKYRCIVTGICGDGDTSEQAILTVIPPPNNIAGIAKDAGFATLYPNPVSGSEIMVKISDALTGSNYHVRIFDQLGRLVNEEEITLSANHTAALDISKMVPGVYNVQVTDNTNLSIDNLRFTKH